MGLFAFPRLTIHQKLTWITTLTCTVALLVAYVAFILLDQNQIRKDTASQLSVLALVIGENCAAAITFGDVTGTVTVLKSIENLPGILVAKVFDPSEKCFASYSPDPSKVPDTTIFRPMGVVFSSDRIELYQPVILDEKLIGTIYLCSDVEKINSRIRFFFLISFLVLLVSLGVAHLLASHTLKPISEPILTLARTAQQVSESTNYSLRAKKTPGASTEIQLLEECFNQMLSKVQEEITERQSAEEEIQQLATAIEQSADHIVITDLGGVIRYVNPAFSQICGYSEEELIGQNNSILKSGKQEASFYKSLWETISSGKIWKGHLINRKKDGTLFEVDAAISPIRDKMGVLRCFVSSGRDVTKEVSLKKQLLQAQKLEAIGTLAGGIAHDFNNVLAAILGFAEISKMQIESGEDALNSIGEITIAGKRAQSLVKQILAFSRKGEFQRTPLRLGHIINEVFKLLRATFPATIVLRIDASLEEDWILGDPTQMHQMLVNLATNAYHAMDDKSGLISVTLNQVKVSTSSPLIQSTLKPGSYLCLRVVDSGCGMEKSVLDRIFEPFFTTKDIGQGTGLGLSVVHGIVQDHGGSIHVESELGIGTTFTILLPRTPAMVNQADKTSIKTSPGLLPVGGGGRILVVDDEVALQVFCKKLLELFHFQVSVSSSGTDGLKLFESDPAAFDLVLSDYSMPNLTGLEMIRKMRKLRSDLPAIIWTGNQKELKEVHTTDEIQRILQKPVAANILIQAVNNCLLEKRVAATDSIHNVEGLGNPRVQN